MTRQVQRRRLRMDSWAARDEEELPDVEDRGGIAQMQADIIECCLEMPARAAGTQESVPDRAWLRSRLGTLASLPWPEKGGTMQLGPAVLPPVNAPSGLPHSIVDVRADRLDIEALGAKTGRPPGAAPRPNKTRLERKGKKGKG